MFTEIATSTLHDACVALSTGMRDLLPIVNKKSELCEYMNLAKTKYQESIGKKALKLVNPP